MTILHVVLPLLSFAYSYQARLFFAVISIVSFPDLYSLSLHEVWGRDFHYTHTLHSSQLITDHVPTLWPIVLVLRPDKCQSMGVTVYIHPYTLHARGKYSSNTSSLSKATYKYACLWPRYQWSLHCEYVTHTYTCMCTISLYPFPVLQLHRL